MSPPQKEIYDFIVEFYSEYPDRYPSLAAMCTGVVGDRRICKKRSGREGPRHLVKQLINKGWLEEKFYRNVAYWVPTD
jgi:hypothetical protein